MLRGTFKKSRLPLVFVPILAILLTAGIAWWLLRPSATAPVSPVAAQPLGVTYVRATQITKNPQGQLQESTVLEIWVDEITKDARLQERSPNGELRRVEVRSGNEYVQYEPGWQSASIRRSSPDDRSLRRIEDRLWLYRDMLQQYPERVVGEAKVNGVAALEARVPAVNKEGGTTEFRVFIDKATSLLLKEVALQQQADGRFVELGTRLTNYQIITTVPRESLPPDFFTLSLPSGTGVEAYHVMTLQEVQNFSAFPLRYLGPAFNGLPLQLVQELRTASTVAPDVQYVHFAYFSSSSASPMADQVVVTNFPVNQPEGPLVKPSMPGEKVAVGGREATLYQRPGRTIVAIDTGPTVVTISANSRDAALAAASAIQLVR